MNTQSIDNSSPGLSLKSLALRGSLWTVAGHGAGQVLRLGSNLVLTRLLFPEVFGLMALVIAFLAGLQMFTDMGLGPNVIQNKRGDEPRFYNTVFTMQVMRGAVLWLGACALALPFAKFYGEPALLQLLPVACASVLVLGFKSTGFHTLFRRLSIRRVVFLELAAMVVRIAVTVFWAWKWPSVWALVAGHLTHSVVMVVASHFIVPDVRNRFVWDKSAALAVFQFGRWVFISTLFTFLAAQADRLVVGKMVTLQVMGVYVIAVIWALVPVEILNKLSDGLIFPLCSRVLTAGHALAPVLGPIRRPVSVGGAMIAAGMMTFGSHLIEILYDPRYAGAGPLLQVLAGAIWFNALGSTCKPVLFALGKSQWGALANGFKFAALVVLMPVGYLLAGLQGVAAGLVIAEMVRYSVFMVGMRRNNMPVLGEDLALSFMLLATVVGCLWIQHGLMLVNCDQWLIVGAQALLLLVCWLPQLVRLRRLFVEMPSPVLEHGS